MSLTEDSEYQGTAIFRLHPPTLKWYKFYFKLLTLILCESLPLATLTLQGTVLTLSHGSKNSGATSFISTIVKVRE